MPKKIYTTVLLTVIIPSLVAGASLFLGPTTATASSVYSGAVHLQAMTAQEATIPSYPCTGNEKVLLIQDVVPWAAPPPGSPLGANVTELLSQNIQFCMINSSQIGNTDLNQFAWILISSAQNQTFYNNLFPVDPPTGGVGSVHPDIVAYVQQGGILSANLTDDSSGPGEGGNWDTGTFVGGLTHVTSFANDNNIADASHLIIRDRLPCPCVNCFPIDDTPLGPSIPQTDLDNWNWSSHGYFTNLPPETQVILTQPDVTEDEKPEPVMIEYSFGMGRVIASMNTSAWRYVGGFGGLPQSKKLLANEIAYQRLWDPCVIEPETNTEANTHEVCTEVEGEIKCCTVLIDEGPPVSVSVIKGDDFCDAEIQPRDPTVTSVPIRIWIQTVPSSPGCWYYTLPTGEDCVVCF